MKIIFVSLFIMLTVKTTTVLADGETGAGAKARITFKKEFAGAETIRWKDLGDYQMATFIFDKHLVEAYFNTESGDLEGSARYLLFDQLPLAIIRAFDKNFNRTDFISALEVSNADGTFYRFIVETHNKRYSAKINTEGSLLHLVKIGKQ